MNPRDRKLVVAALVRDLEDRVLLSQRRADQAMAQKWELPGGKVEPGEAPVAALEREIQEELGARCRVGAIYEVVFHAYPEFDLVMLVYVCELIDPPRAVQVAAVDWVALDRLHQVDLLPADRPLAERLNRSQ